MELEGGRDYRLARRRTSNKEDLRLTHERPKAADPVALRLRDAVSIGHGTERWVNLAEREVL